MRRCASRLPCRSTPTVPVSGTTLRATAQRSATSAQRSSRSAARSTPASPIARGSTLSLALIFLGVLGGVIAFGFIGVILGPVLLALGIALGREWISARQPSIPDATGAVAAAAATAAVDPAGSTPKAS